MMSLNIIILFEKKTPKNHSEKNVIFFLCKIN